MSIDIAAGRETLGGEIPFSVATQVETFQQTENPVEDDFDFTEAALLADSNREVMIVSGTRRPLSQDPRTFGAVASIIAQRRIELARIGALSWREAHALDVASLNQKYIELIEIEE